ncbi:MAG: hypothetical protein R2932_01665 [Caldilineaceae bacterium]
MVTPTWTAVNEGISFRQALPRRHLYRLPRSPSLPGMHGHNTGVYTFQQWAHHRCCAGSADAGYWCVNIGKMHFSPRDVPGGFHERVIVENPTNKDHANGRADDDWGNYLHFHGQERPNDRNQSDPTGCANIKACPGISKSVSTATSLSATRR